MKVKSLSRVQLFMIPWIAAYQAPPSMGFSRQEYYWSGWPLPSPLCQLDSLNNNPVYETAKETLMYRTVLWTVGEGEGGKIWENGIETCKISCMK